jgi:hypothetical protein
VRQKSWSGLVLAPHFGHCPMKGLRCYVMDVTPSFLGLHRCGLDSVVLWLSQSSASPDRE